MSDVKWLLQTDVFDENLSELTDEITRQGMEFKVVEFKHFGMSTGLQFEFPENSCVITYGSLQMSWQLRRETEWIPGVICDFPNYNCSNYYPIFGEHLLNSDYIMLPFGDLKRRKDYIFDTFGKSNSIFIRPNSGSKDFTGKVSYRENFEQDLSEFQMSMGGDNLAKLTSEHLVLIAEPRFVDCEWRFIVVDGKAIAGSQYKRREEGESISNNIDPAVTKYAQSVLDDVDFDPDIAWCLDICEADGYGNFHVLEVGGFSSAGLYAADKAAIVEHVSRAAHNEWLEYQDDTF